jgi:hypothetical protein
LEGFEAVGLVPSLKMFNVDIFNKPQIDPPAHRPLATLSKYLPKPATQLNTPYTHNLPFSSPN